MQLVTLARNPVPSGAAVGELIADDGVRLRYARWAATRGPRRGTVCLFGGRGEFIEKYFEVIADLRRRGFAVATMDWRGQGGSERLLRNPRKGHVTSFRDYERDLFRFMKDIVLPDCPPPFVGLAHSMGGTILLHNTVKPGSWFERVVLSAPLVALNQVHVHYPQVVVRAYSELSSFFGMSTAYVRGGYDMPEEQVAFKDNRLTSDHERWSRNKSILDVAPELGIGSPTVQWLRAICRACARVQNPSFAARVQVPMLVFAAGNDKIVSTPAIEDFCVGLKVGTHILLPGSQHEILQESDDVRQRFWAAFDAYLGIRDVEVR